MDGSASPLKPKVETASRSAIEPILLVAWRNTDSFASSAPIPRPSSLTCMRVAPPPPTSISMREAPASRAFSTSSFITEAGRSTTSPAATCWATNGSSTRTLKIESQSPCCLRAWPQSSLRHLLDTMDKEIVRAERSPERCFSTEAQRQGASTLVGGQTILSDGRADEETSG